VRESDRLLMIAARAPVPGATKTRLGRTIGMDRAAALARAFLADLAAKLTPASAEGGYDLAWTYSPPDVEFRQALCAIAGEMPATVRFQPQIADEDWGHRQRALLRWGHDEGYARSVLVASDSPQIQPGAIARAFAALETSAVVLGRVHDGGYYLIGQRGFHEVFEDVPMSTASAADALVARAASLGLRVAEVPGTFDVDVEADLDLLRSHLAACGGRDAPVTWRALRELGLR
jgi:rSAM/selenodomain-associated transferase 1